MPCASGLTRSCSGRRTYRKPGSGKRPGCSVCDASTRRRRWLRDHRHPRPSGRHLGRSATRSHSHSMRSYAGRSPLREILASIRTQPTFTLVTLLLVGASTLTVIMTAGWSAASEAAVLATIDAQGTRTIVIQATGSQSGIDEQLVATLARLSDVEAVTGFGAVTDVTAAANPAGSRIGLRTGYGTINGIPLTQPSPGRIGPVVWASRPSTQVVGLPDGAGSLRAIDGPEYLIARTLTVPDYLAEPSLSALFPPSPGSQTSRPVRFRRFMCWRAPRSRSPRSAPFSRVFLRMSRATMSRSVPQNPW